MARESTATVTETPTPGTPPTVEELLERANALRFDPNADAADLLKALSVHKAAVDAVDRAERERVANEARVAFDTKMAAIAGPRDAMVEAVRAIALDIRPDCISAGVSGWIIVIDETPDAPTVSIKPTGPGVPGIPAKSAKAVTGNGTRAPRATLADGRSWKDVADGLGLIVGVSSAHLVVFRKARTEHDAIPHDCGLITSA